MALLGFGRPAGAAGISEAEKQKMIADSVAAYLATGHPCACPYSLDRRGRPCGNRSAYVRPGGARPLCYPADIDDNGEAIPPPR